MEINKVENMAQKKALVITYYDAPNYGAFLQAYGTQCFLRSHGVDAQICRHIANKPTIITKLLDKRSDPEVTQYRNKIQAVIDEAQKYLHVTKGREIYDLAILGSDEIWNVKNLTAVHLPVFFQPYQKAARCHGSGGGRRFLHPAGGKEQLPGDYGDLHRLQPYGPRTQRYRDSADRFRIQRLSRI